jgi:hypothetical protein
MTGLPNLNFPAFQAAAHDTPRDGFASRMQAPVPAIREDSGSGSISLPNAELT